MTENYEETMTAIKRIVTTAKMSTRPEYYSGRGAIRSDLNGTILKTIFDSVKTDFGDEAANSFVEMVKGMKQLSATAFLNELYQLAQNDFIFTASVGFGTMEIAKDKDGNYDMNHGMISMMSALTNLRDETTSIRNEFLWMIGERIQEPRMVTNGRRSCYD